MTTSVINFTPAALGDEVVAVACLLIPDQQQCEASAKT